MAQYKGAASEAGRAMQLMKKREKEREQLEQLKQKIAEVCHHLSRIITSFLSCWSFIQSNLLQIYVLLSCVKSQVGSC